MKLSLNKKIIFSQIIILLFTIIPLSVAHSATMTSGNYSIERDSMNFGGSHTTGSSRILEDTIGEVGAGDINSSNYKINAGYQQSNAVSSSGSGSDGSSPVSSSSGSHRSSVNVLNFQANPISESINLTWQYPFQASIDSVKIIRSTKFFPTNLGDGEIIFEGNSNSVIDNNVIPGITYYYAIFAKSASGVYSSGVLAQTILPKKGDIKSTIKSVEILDRLPSATNVDPAFKGLSFLDFNFIQDSILINHAKDIVPIDGNKPLTISLDYKKVPETLKTIAISISDSESSNKVFTFLLRVNKDKTAYEATIGSLGKNGDYKINAIVLDYKNQSLKRFNGVLKASVFESVKNIVDTGSNLKINYKIVFILVIIFSISTTIGLFIYKKHKENIRNRNIFISIILILSFVFTPFAQAAINKQINYQGKLNNSLNVAVADGTYSMVFKLYTVSSGGSPIWTETLSGANKVQVTNGLFSVMLGAVDSLSSVDFNQTLYLGVDIEGDGEMSPRKIIGAVPSAFVADTLDGLDSTQFLRSDFGSVSSGYFIATTTTSSIFPYASTTAISASTICISSDCRTMWPSSGGTGGGTWSTTTSNVFGEFINYSNNNSDIVAIGSNSTTSAKYYFDPNTQTASIGGRLTLMHASSTAQTISGNLYLSTLNGPLQANNGLVTATTSIGVVYGGTGLTTAPSYGNVLVGNALGGYTLTATSSLGIVVGSPFPFTPTLFGATTANATSTLIGFTNGIYSLASSTIGNGNQNGGLTISGGATTTGSMNIRGRLTVGTTTDNSHMVNVVTTSLTQGISLSGPNSSFTVTPNKVEFFPEQTGTNKFVVYNDANGGYRVFSIETGNSSNVGTTTSHARFLVQPEQLSDGEGIFAVKSQSGKTVLTVNTNSAGGNVGIGTTSPGQRLSVAGDILGNNIIGSYFTATSTTATTTFNGGLSVGGTGLNFGASTEIYQNGQSFLISTTSTKGNLAIGYQASPNIDSGQGIQSTYIGYQSGSIATSSINSTAVGYKTLASLITDPSFGGGYENSAFGVLSMYNTTRGYSNSAFGNYSLYNNTTGYENTAFGDRALLSNTTGFASSAFGKSALANGSNSSSSVAFGYYAGAGLGGHTKQGGTYIGAESGLSASNNSDFNTFVGYRSGYSVTTGSNNIAIGANIELPNNTGTQQLNIGNLLYGTGIYNGAALSSSPVSGGAIGIGTTSPWRTLSVKGSSDLGNNALAGNFTATTSTASIFPYASTTALTVSSSAFFPSNGVWNSSGFVGIGTTSPYAALSVAGASGVVANVYSATSTTATSTFAGGLNVGSGNLVYDLSTGITSATAFQTGNLNFENDAGMVSWVDMGLTSASPNDTPQGYTAFLNGSSTISVYGLSNGNGYLQADYPRVAIGSTTAPTSKLTVFANGSGTNSVFETLNSSNTSLLKVLESGSVGIGSSTPWRKLSVVGTVALNGLTSSATGNAVCISANKDITDAGGASCTPSSIRFKENVIPLVSGYAIDELSKLSVVNFDYIEKQPFETNKSYGLIAEEVEKIDKNLVDYGYDGKPLSLHFEKITGLLIQAVQEQQKQIKNLSSTTPSFVLASNTLSSVTPSTTINTIISSSTLDTNSEIQSMKNDLYGITSSSTLMSSIASSTLDLISNSIASTTADKLTQSDSFISNVTSILIERLSSLVLNLKSIFVKEIHVEEKLCVDDVCVNKEQLKAILLNAGAGHTTTLISNPIPSEESTNQNLINTTQDSNSNNLSTSTEQIQEPSLISTSTPITIPTLSVDEQNNNQNNTVQNELISNPTVQTESTITIQQ